MPKVFVILVSYNSKRFLDACIGSLLKQDCGDIQIVIVDNASPDDSNSYIEEHFPEVTLLKEPLNHGFGKACNIGVRYALEHGADYVLFLNTDTEADANLVTELTRLSAPDTVTTCFTYNDKATLKSWYAGGRLNRQTLDSEQTLYPYNPSQGPVEVEFISGCCMMVHKDVFAKAGFFDESYFMYYEDAEWCARLRQHGIKLLYVQSTKLFHYEAGSQKIDGDGSRTAQYYNMRNALMLAFRHPELLDVSPVSLLRRSVVRTQPFHVIGRDKISYEKKGIEDFLESKTGQLESPCLEFGEGFWDAEYNSGIEFRYCVSPVSIIRLCNYSDFEQTARFHFDIQPAPGRTSEEISLHIDGKNSFTHHTPCSVDEVLKIPAHDVRVMEFMTGTAPSKMSGDSRPFYFKVENITCRQGRGLEVVKSISVSSEETDGRSRWSWVTEKSCSVTIWNFHDGDRNIELKALLTPSPLSKEGLVDIYLDGKPYRRGFKMPGRLDDIFRIKQGGRIVLEFKYDGDLQRVGADPRTFAFAIRDVEVSCQD